MLSIFARLDDKHNLLEILNKLSKIFKIFLKKIAKNMLAYLFQRNLRKHALIFRAFGRKTQIVWKF